MAKCLFILNSAVYPSTTYIPCYNIKWPMVYFKKVVSFSISYVTSPTRDLLQLQPYESSHLSTLYSNGENVATVSATITVRYHDGGSKELNACIQFLLHMVYLWPKHKLLLFADNMYKINMHAYIHLQWCFPWLTHPCFHLWLIPFPLARINCPLYLLGDPSSCDRGANIHPLSFLISYQLFPPCCLNHPIDQVTCLHRRHHNICRSVWYNNYHHDVLFIIVLLLVSLSTC